jgi:hypothetical protein
LNSGRWVDIKASDIDVIEGIAGASLNVDKEPGCKGKLAGQAEKIYVNSNEQTTHNLVIFSSGSVALLHWYDLARGHIPNPGWGC